MLRLLRVFSKVAPLSLLSPLAVVGIACACMAAACSVSFESSAYAPLAAPLPLNDDAGISVVADAGPTADAGSFADVAIAPIAQGSPLCNASEAHGCFPDDPRACATDAGAADASAPSTCRVEWGSGASIPTATCNAFAGTGVDGAACARSADCASGFECVGSPGQCRQYCCSQDSCNALIQFCDIQQTAADPSTRTYKVPVCMPLRACTLLSPGCPADETCGIVAPNGATSCVALGLAKAGDSCESDHCGGGLACLGDVGTRQCYQLCHTANPTECMASQKCRTGGAVFPDPAFGLCESAM